MTRRDPTTGRFVKGASDLKPLTASEVYEIAAAMLKNELFLATSAEELERCFMLLVGLMREDQIPRNAFTMVGENAHRIHLSVNGLPIFHTGRWLTRDDTVAVLDEYHRLKNLLKAAGT